MKIGAAEKLRPHIRQVLQRIAQNADPSELDRCAANIADMVELKKIFQPVQHRQGSSAGRKSMERINGLIGRTQDAIEQLGTDERLALRDAGVMASEMQKALEVWNRAIVRAHPELTPVRKGRKSAHLQTEIVVYLARIYRELTGKEPTRGTDRGGSGRRGAFRDLVVGVFELCEFRDNADYHIQQALTVAEEKAVPRG